LNIMFGWTGQDNQMGMVRLCYSCLLATLSLYAIFSCILTVPIYWVIRRDVFKFIDIKSRLEK
jgi:hypothetical protein